SPADARDDRRRRPRWRRERRTAAVLSSARVYDVCDDPRAQGSRSRSSPMILINDPLRQTDLPRGCVATIGNFDGMHIAHQAIIRGVVERARATGRPSAVITFHPHPLSIVAPDRVPPQILTL